MSQLPWTYLAVVAAVCLTALAVWAGRAYGRWRRDLRHVRAYREAVQTPYGRALFRRMLAARDAYDAEMERHLHGGSSS